MKNCAGPVLRYGTLLCGSRTAHRLMCLHKTGTISHFSCLAFYCSTTRWSDECNKRSLTILLQFRINTVNGNVVGTIIIGIIRFNVFLSYC